MTIYNYNYAIKVCLITLNFLFLGISCNVPQNTTSVAEQSEIKSLAVKPPMGWNSWNCFGIEVTEDQVEAVADYMSEHLKDYGWEYVVVDAGWYHAASFTTPQWNDDPAPPQLIDEYGRLLPDPDKFPSSVNGVGFKSLADYVHSKGLKFGIHIMRGIPWNSVKGKTKVLGTEYTADEIAEENNVCEWTHVMEGINMTHPGAMAYYRSIVDLYASWGVDYIKADDMSRPYRADEIHALSQVLNESERPIVLSLSPGAAPLMAANDLRKNAHLWRISGDFWDSWASLKEMFHLCEIWAPYITENHWPDADMLPLGKLRKNGVGDWEASLFNATSAEVTDEYSRLTPTEQYTLMNLWAIFKSPLMMGGYLPENDSLTLALLTNPDIIEVNQTSANNQVVNNDDIKAVWVAESADKKAVYTGIFNVSEKVTEISLSFSEIGLGSGKSFTITDLWTGEEISMQENLSVTLQPHASVLYKILK